MAAKTKQEYEDELLEAWEETYKKGQLTFWIFLSLKQEDRYADEILQFVRERSGGVLTCEEQSLYRVLRKYRDLDMVGFHLRPGAGGPERKYYYLTSLGTRLLQRFIERNIRIFFTPELQKLLTP